MVLMTNALIDSIGILTVPVFLLNWVLW